MQLREVTSVAAADVERRRRGADPELTGEVVQHRRTAGPEALVDDALELPVEAVDLLAVRLGHPVAQPAHVAMVPDLPTV